jgi:UDP-N-acetylmuramoyl-tripeptide--D-alanyl-D-alanine ligase
LARETLTGLVNTDVVAVTGSSGKTTTKDLMASVFALRGGVVAPVGSFNTEVGLPLTVLSADSSTRTLVLEMGARGIGHVAYLCQIATPSVAVVLNVGSAHVGEFGGQDKIAQAKAEILADLPTGGTAVLNCDDPLVATMPVPSGATRITFGESPKADVRVVNLTLDELARPSFTLSYRGQNAAVSLNLSGEHNAHNAAAVAGAAIGLGMELDSIADALSSATARSKLRMEVTLTESGVIVINDSYNANPESARAAMKSLVEIGRAHGTRTWAVLGEMKELGDQSLAEHDSLGRMAVRLDVSRLVAVGAGAKLIHLGASQEGSWADESVWVPDAQAASALLANEVSAGDVVLVKASRAVGLETVAEDLLASENAK